LIHRGLILWVLAAAGVAFAQSYGESGETVDTYQGPSVLSRGGSSVAGERAGRLIDFQFWGDVNAVYDSGLAGLIVGPNGNIESSAGEAGVVVGGGIVGTRVWEHDLISIDYGGDFRHYSPNSYYDGTDQFLQFNWRHILSRRWSLDVHDMGGITSLSYGTLSYVPLRSADVVGLPSNLLFDNTVYFEQAGAEVFFQKSARLSFGVGVDGFLTDYRSSSLASVRGVGAKADAVYRLSRRQKLYLTYQFSRFDYQHAFGFSNLNLGAAGYSVDIGRRWTIEGQAGVYYVHTLGLIQQPVAPAIAAILGTSYVTTTADRRIMVPDGELRVSRRFKKSSFDIGASETVSPGNGVYLTSRSESSYAHYSFVGNKRLTMGATVGYGSLSSVGQQSIGKYVGYNGGAGGSYRIWNNVHSEMRYDFNHYTTETSGFKQNENRVTVGVAFSSGDRPLALW